MWLEEHGRSPARVRPTSVLCYDAQDAESGRRNAALRDSLIRLFDICASLAGLAILAVPIALIALAIKIESRGPVYYRCRRVGRYGREFGVIKFRKMRDGATGPALTLRGDQRFTRLGSLLSSYKLDEIPQLVNVLRAEMSLVGPRPEDRVFVDEYEREYANEILQVRPGITGLTQLAFGYSEAMLLDTDDPDRATQRYVQRLLPQKVELDRRYVADRSIRMNLSVVWWTFLAAFLRYDVAVNRETCRLGRRRRPNLKTDLQTLPQSFPIG
jgi:lipopolysaccharide/colanic/teichoic acid biosynthesis glycosyltransferase